MTDVLLDAHPQGAEQSLIDTQDAETALDEVEALRARLDSLSDPFLPLTDRLNTAFDLLRLDADSIDPRATVSHLVSERPMMIGDRADVHIAFTQTGDDYTAAVVVGTSGVVREEYGAYRLPRDGSEAVHLTGGMTPEAVLEIAGAGLSDITLEALGIVQPDLSEPVDPPAPESVRVDTPEPRRPENKSREMTVYDAAMGLTGDLFIDVPCERSDGAEAVERRHVTIVMDKGDGDRRYKVAESRGTSPACYQYEITVEGLGDGPAVLILTPDGVKNESPNRKWRDRTNDIRTIEDVFALFCRDLLELDALRQ